MCVIMRIWGGCDIGHATFSRDSGKYCVTQSAHTHTNQFHIIFSCCWEFASLANNKPEDFDIKYLWVNIQGLLLVWDGLWFFFILKNPFSWLQNSKTDFVPESIQKVDCIIIHTHSLICFRDSSNFFFLENDWSQATLMVPSLFGT